LKQQASSFILITLFPFNFLVYQNSGFWAKTSAIIFLTHQLRKTEFSNKNTVIQTSKYSFSQTQHILQNKKR